MRFAMRLLLICTMLIGWPAAAFAAQFMVLIDNDQSTATGCQVNLPPTVDGVEFRIIATVADVPAPTTVTSVTLEECQSGSFGPAATIGGGQPLGNNNGIGAADVIELAVSEGLIGSAVVNGDATLHFVSVGSGGADLTVAAPFHFVSTASAAAIPSLSAGALIVLALLIAAFGRRGGGAGRHLGLTLVLLCTSGGILIAAQFVVDGDVSDWAGVAPLVSDPGGDAADNGIDIVAGFVAQEAGKAFFRIDVRNLGSNAPEVTPASYTLAENSAAGSTVGTVGFINHGGGASHSFAITAGNTGGAFAIDPASGQLTVASSGALNFETTPTFALTVEVTDDHVPPRSGSGLITVTLSDVNEAPVVTAASFAVAEHSPIGTVLGTVGFSDPDAGQSHSFAITAGNTGNAFSINAGSGQITVADAAQIVAGAGFTLTVSVTDNGSPAQSGTAAVTINVTDVNDPPVVTDASFSLDEHSAAGTAVGTVVASDPDLPAQTLSYALTAGNGSGAFAIDAAGAVTVANPAALDFETTPSFTLTVTVTDNGSPALSATGTLTVTLNDINDAPVVQAASFALDERSANGTAVGTVTASDADLPAQTLSYAITAGNTGTAFALDAASGALTVANSSALDHATQPTFSLTVQATDNGSPARSGSATVTVTLNDINDPPAPAGGPFAVLENSTAGAIVGTVAANDPDSGQSHSFAITGGDGATAFAIDPASGQITVSGNVALNFETKNAYSLTVQATDNGTPALSASTTITLSIVDVNEAPSIADTAFSVAENSANGTVVGSVPVTDPDAGQSHSYAILSGNTGGAYAIGAGGQITVANGGVLDYETPGMRTLTLTIQVTDNGTPALTDTATVTVSLTDVNEAPSAAARSYDAHTNLPISVPAGSGLLVGSVDPEGDSLSVGMVSASTPAGAVINAAADGSFTFTPPPGVTGPVSFTYQACDAGALCGSNTVTVTVAGPAVWFVDANAAAGGNGTQSAPFKTLAAASSAASAGSRVFVAAGSYADGIILPATSRLIGHGASGDFDTALGLGTLPTHAVARPTLGGATPTIGAVTIGSSANVQIRGVAISAGAVTALSASGATGLDIADTSVAAASATAVSLSSTTGSVLLSSTNSNGGTNNVALSGVSGTVVLGSGALSGATGAALVVNNSGGAISYAGSITNTTQGVTLTSNTGTISLSGVLALDTTTNAAFTATGGGTVQATNPDNTLSTTTATALNVTNTTIGAGGLRFKRIGSNGGATAGIVLSNTGATGGLSVLGDGSAGSGGTIQGKAASCISVSNSRDLHLASMVLQNCQTHGLDASNLTHFSLTNSTVSANGNAANERGLNFNGLYGTASITGTIVTASASDNLYVANSSGTLTQLNIAGPGCTFSNTLGANGNDGILIVGDSTATMSVAVSNCSFTNHRGDHFQASTSGSNTATMNVSFTGNTLSHTSGSVGAGVTIASADGAMTTATVSDNTITGAVASAITVSQGYNNAHAGAALKATLANNVIGSSGVANSGSAQGDGITVTQNGSGTLTTLISNNTIRQYANAFGIQFVTGDGSGTFNGTLSGNTVSEPAGELAANGFQLNAGLVASDAGTVCLALDNNQMAGAGNSAFGYTDFRLRQRQATTVRLPGYSGGASDTAAVTAYVQAGRINGSGNAAVSGAGAGFTNAAACPTP